MRTLRRLNMRHNFVLAITLVCGITYTLTGFALIFAPEWFFANIGNFAPYNRHYMGDAGTFSFPLGCVLLLGLRYPKLLSGALAINALLSLLHALNHVYDDVLSAQVSFNTVYLLALGLLACVAWWFARKD